MSDTRSSTRSEISAAIAEKAWKDEAFRKAILADANKVYEEHTGHSLPQGITIKVLEDTADTVHFVIPAKPADAGELSDAELEAVAGGLFFAIPLIMTALNVGVSAAAVHTKGKGGW